MIPAVTAIEVHVVDAPIDPGVLAAGRAAQTAARNCGDWLDSGSLSELMAAVGRAEREVERAIRVEDRFWRRFGRAINDEPAASMRLAVRRAIARSIVASRIETVRLLTGPMAGSA
jgi:hypothetical protein